MMSSVSKKPAVLACLATVAGLLAFPNLAEAKNNASQSFRLKARVPVSCWVRPDRTVEAAPGATGSVVEACNNPGGYTVTAQYRQLNAGENARMIYNDRAIDLSSSGQQMLRQSSIATIRTVSYQFENVHVDQPLILSLTIQPL